MVSSLRRRLLQSILAVVVLAAAVTAGVVFLRQRSPSPLARTHHRAVTIPASGGVRLAAEVTAPQGSRRRPLIVMPASLGSNGSQYRVLAGRLATAGYAVVAYAQRGVRDSTGQMDFAGSPTVGDVSTVISWALAHTRADPRRIGLAGVSYGGGISLLAAARDARVKAVVALSTWTDLAGALAQNGTLEVRAAQELFGRDVSGSRPTTQLAELGRQVTSDPSAALATVAELSRTRSPVSSIAALNARHVAIMLANGWEDSIFPPEPLVGFFERLTGPKRLEFGTGDHGGPETTGITGTGANRTVDDARAWLDRYVQGDAGTALGEPVQIQDVATGVWHEFADWPRAGTGDTITLTDPRVTGIGGTTTARATSWRAGLRTGTDTRATSGPSQFEAAAAYRPPTATMDRAPGRGGLSWASGVVGAATLIDGTPTLQLPVESSARAATLFVYLYDVSATGTGRLMTVTPFTLIGLSATRRRVEELALNPICWTIAAGHHVVLTIDSVDPRYGHAERAGSTVTVVSTPRTAARLTAHVSS